jgi:hypothetical protein
MGRKVHYQPDFDDYEGEGNFEPFACETPGRNCQEDADPQSTHSWSSVTCKRCLSKKPLTF